MKWYGVYFDYKVANTERSGYIVTMAHNSLDAELETTEMLFVEMDGESEFMDCSGGICTPKFVKVTSSAEFEWNEDVEEEKSELYEEITDFNEYFNTFGFI